MAIGSPHLSQVVLNISMFDLPESLPPNLGGLLPSGLSSPLPNLEGLLLGLSPLGLYSDSSSLNLFVSLFLNVEFLLKFFMFILVCDGHLFIKLRLILLFRDVNKSIFYIPNAFINLYIAAFFAISSYFTLIFSFFAFVRFGSLQSATYSICFVLYPPM